MFYDFCLSVPAVALCSSSWPGIPPAPALAPTPCAWIKGMHHPAHSKEVQFLKSVSAKGTKNAITKIIAISLAITEKLKRSIFSKPTCHSHLRAKDRLGATGIQDTKTLSQVNSPIT